MKILGQVKNLALYDAREAYKVYMQFCQVNGIQPINMAIRYTGKYSTTSEPQDQKTLDQGMLPPCGHVADLKIQQLGSKWVESKQLSFRPLNNGFTVIYWID